MKERPERFYKRGCGNFRCASSSIPCFNGVCSPFLLRCRSVETDFRGQHARRYIVCDALQIDECVCHQFRTAQTLGVDPAHPASITCSIYIELHGGFVLWTKAVFSNHLRKETLEGDRVADQFSRTPRSKNHKANDRRHSLESLWFVKAGVTIRRRIRIVVKLHVA